MISNPERVTRDAEELPQPAEATDIVVLHEVVTPKGVCAHDVGMRLIGSHRQNLEDEADRVERIMLSAGASEEDMIGAQKFRVACSLKESCHVVLKAMYDPLSDRTTIELSRTRTSQCDTGEDEAYPATG